MPDEKFTAEVLVLITTLGAKKTEFNAGRRVRDFLECKRVHHKIIDFNRDARAASRGFSTEVCRPSSSPFTSDDTAIAGRRTGTTLDALV